MSAPPPDFTTKGFWFGPAQRRIFGVLDHPSYARAGVVLCPPFGYEHVCAYRTFRLLAQRLARAGMAVLRLDYDGTGNSSGNSDDPGRVGAWVRSVELAASELRLLGLGSIALVGMRLGATLAAEAARAAGPLDGLVLWDPCPTGGTFLRQSRMLHAVGLDPQAEASTAGVEAAGVFYAPETVEALRRLDLAHLDPGPDGPARRILVLTRPGRPLPSGLRRLFEIPSGVDMAPAEGQEQLVDVLSPLAEVPTVTLDRVAGWLGDALARTQATPMDSSGLATRSVVGHTPGGEAIEEEARFLPPAGIFAVTTRLGSDRSPETPWVLSTNNGVDHHIGPRRLWVDMGRRLAARGIRSARFDLSGLGESHTRPGQAENVVYAPESVEDVIQVARALRPDDPHDMVLVGLCSSAYLAVQVAATFSLRGICAINPYLNFKPRELLAEDRMGPTAWATPPTRRLVRRFKETRTRDWVDRRLPPYGWHLLDKLDVHPSPSRGVAQAVRSGVDTLLVFGKEDEALVDVQRRGSVGLRRLAGKPGFSLVTVADMDHAVMRRGPREELAQLLEDHICRILEPTRPPERLGPTRARTD